MPNYGSQMKQRPGEHEAADLWWLASLLEVDTSGNACNATESIFNFFLTNIKKLPGEKVAAILRRFENFKQRRVGHDEGNVKMDAEPLKDYETLIKALSPEVRSKHTRAELDHLFFVVMQEAINPGYLRRMQQISHEVPDLGAMVGGSPQ